jgi:hypothetical protein
MRFFLLYQSTTTKEKEINMDMDFKGEGQSVLLPSGWTEVMVTNVSYEMSKSNNEMWVITAEEPESGSCDVTYAVLTKGKRWLMKSFVEACNFVKDADGVYHVEPSECVGLTVEALNQPEENKFVRRDGTEVVEMRNRFTKFRAAENKATV